MLRPRVKALAASIAIGAILAMPATVADAADAERPRPDARAWVLIDADDQEVLAGARAAQPAAIASTTKLMTAYVARRKLDLDRRIVAPAYDGDPVESLLGLREGERIRVRDLLAGLLLASGNDAAVALAEASAGSVEAFVAEMNRSARQLGLASTRYANPIGLDQPGNRSSPVDLAALAAELRRDPFLRRLLGLPRIRLLSGARRREVTNRNELVGRFPWVNGVKTGHTLDAGHVLVGSGTRKGVTLISVVLGAPDEDARDAATLELLRYGFSLYRRATPITSAQRLATAAVRHRDETLPLLAARRVRLTLRAGQRVETRIVAPQEVEGPVDRGDRIGRALVLVDGEVAGRVPLLAGRAIGAATLPERVDAAVPGPRGVVWALGAATLGLALATAILALRSRRRRRLGG